jgi:hypothetical protein
MKKLVLLFSTVALLSCDDGNQDTPEFNFDNVIINDCGNLVLSQINGTEVFIIELDEDNTEDAFLTELREDGETFTLSESGSNTITYRTFDSEPTTDYFCQNIPPTSPTVTNEWTGTGDLIVTTTLSIDDNDDVLAEDEDIDGNSDFTNDDTDGDTIADYIDFDDDNDGIKTADEDIDGDDNPMNDDTDGDGIPNYLDADDDGDGVDTAFEALIDTDSDGGGADYLDPNTTTLLIEARILLNEYEETYSNSFTVNLLQLINPNATTISYDSYFFGLKTVKVTNDGSIETR